MAGMIKEAIDEALRTRAAILEEHPELAFDLVTLNDTVDGEVKAGDLVAWLIRKARDAEMLAAAGLAHATAVEERAKRMRATSESLQRTAMMLGVATEMLPLRRPDFTFGTARVNPSVVITDAKLIPPTYRHDPKPAPEPAPDKEAIKLALEAGLAVPGAMLSNGGVRPNVRWAKVKAAPQPAEAAETDTAEKGATDAE